MGNFKNTLLAAATGLAFGLMPLLASAQEHYAHHEFHDRDVGHFRGHDLDVWRGGHWLHEWRNGRFGWWWFAGGAWYFYDTPVYPYPNVVSEVTVIEPSAPPPQPGGAPLYYYCDNPAGYFPYVQSCSVPFRPVPAAPQGGYAPPPSAAPAPNNTPPPPR